MSEVEKIVRGLATSTGGLFGTNAPYSIDDDVKIERVGYACLPMCLVHFYCREEDVRALIPIVRQKVYRWFEAQGVPSDVLKLVPGVSRVKDRAKFTDENPSSPTCGKNKIGVLNRFSVDIADEGLHYIEWDRSWGKYGNVRKGAG